MKTANGKTDVVPDVSVSARKGAGSWIIRRAEKASHVDAAKAFARSAASAEREWL